MTLWDMYDIKKTRIYIDEGFQLTRDNPIHFKEERSNPLAGMTVKAYIWKIATLRYP